jgi:hypothetical protein
MMSFERTGDIKKGLGLGKRERIHRWFREWVPYARYEIGDDLSVYIKGSLIFINTQVTHLPEGLSVGGSLHLQDSQMTQLPEDLNVGGSLYLQGSQVTQLPDDLCVSGDIYIEKNQDILVPENLKHKIRNFYI